MCSRFLRANILIKFQPVTCTWGGNYMVYTQNTKIFAVLNQHRMQYLPERVQDISWTDGMKLASRDVWLDKYRPRYVQLIVPFDIHCRASNRRRPTPSAILSLLTYYSYHPQLIHLQCVGLGGVSSARDQRTFRPFCPTVDTFVGLLTNFA